MNISTAAAPDPRTARTVGELLRKRAEMTPDKPIFVPIGRDGPEPPITYGVLHDQATIIARALHHRASRGDRVVLVFPNEPAFVYVFLGCLLAGVVAVPIAVPRNPKGMSRLLAIADAADARVGVMSALMKTRMAKLGADAAKFDWIEPETLLNEGSSTGQLPQTDGSDIAVLQFTSGSTGLPKAVMVRHSNILHNSAMLQSVCGAGDEMRMLSWLPFFHDWGLFGCLIFPIFTGGLSHFMDPNDFLRSPMFWIEMIGHTRSQVSCAPDFAYAQAARDAKGQSLDDLDLSAWRLAMMGAEPVRSRTINDFTKTFASCGFRRNSFYPSYGLAESTLIVSGGDPFADPVVRQYNRNSYQLGRAEAVNSSDQSQEIVGVGKGLLDQRVAIVDPQTGQTRPEGSIGEIWVSGPSITAGYLNRPKDTEAAYEGELAGDNANWLRTGDLGFFDQHELFVCGRLKDVIIKAGVNYLAEDVEHSVVACHPSLRASAGAVFGVEVAGAERLVIAYEIAYGPRPDLDQVVGAIQMSVKEDHDVFADAILILKPGTLEKTSSGKIRRRKTAEDFVAGDLQPLKMWKNWRDD